MTVQELEDLLRPMPKGAQVILSVVTDDVAGDSAEDYASAVLLRADDEEDGAPRVVIHADGEDC